MSPFKELFERLQSEVGQISDALRGQAAERVLDAEIREIDDSLHDWRNEAAAAKARIITSEEREKQLGAEIRKLEADALKALQGRRKSRASQIAEAIVNLQARRADERQTLKALNAHQQAMLHVIEQGEHKLRRLKHQLDTLRASETLQRAQATVARRQPGAAPHPESAVASAKRARKANAAEAATRKPRPAPPADDALEAVLERLRAKATTGNEAAPSAQATGKKARKPSRKTTGEK